MLQLNFSEYLSLHSCNPCSSRLYHQVIRGRDLRARSLCGITSMAIGVDCQYQKTDERSVPIVYGDFLNKIGLTRADPARQGRFFRDTDVSRKDRFQ